MRTADSGSRESSVLAIPRSPVLSASSPFKPGDFTISTRGIFEIHIVIESDAITAKILPQFYHQCDLEDLVLMVSTVIEEAISENDENSVPLLSKGLTPFHSLLKPSITVRDYLSRITKHAALTPAMLLSMMYYIDRLSSIFPAFLINSFTAHRFLITAATVACKGLSDSFLRTVAYARIGGVKASELRRLVRLFLYYLDWGIVPHPETLVAYYRGLVTRSDGYIFEPVQGFMQGTLNPVSYSEFRQDRRAPDFNELK